MAEITLLPSNETAATAGKPAYRREIDLEMLGRDRDHLARDLVGMAFRFEILFDLARGPLEHLLRSRHLAPVNSGSFDFRNAVISSVVTRQARRRGSGYSVSISCTSKVTS